MESCSSPGCAMGIASEATNQADGGASQTLCLKSCLGNHCWTGQHEAAMELLVLPQVCSSKAETGEEMAKPQIPLESCLQEERLEQQNPFCKKTIPDAAEDKQLPRPLKKESEETCLQGALDYLHSSAAMGSVHPEEVLVAIPSLQKPCRGRKSKKKAIVCKGPTLKEPSGQGEVPGPSEKDPVPPVKVPKKRGRKSKAEMLLLKLSQGLECQSPDPLCPQKVPANSEDLACLETTPGGRPKRRAAKAALLYLQELAEELTSVYQAPPCNEAPEEPKKKRGRKPLSQKLESEEDADFVPSDDVLQQAEEEEEEEEEMNELLLSEASESELEFSLHGASKAKLQNRGFASNGLHNSIMCPVWKSLDITHRLREQLHSPWEFPEWIPSALKWTFLSEREAEGYLPGETRSPFFSIKREGLQEDSILYRINSTSGTCAPSCSWVALSETSRFNALQPHEKRLDITFFVGGPVWAMEWCPTPAGSVASQYLALYCNSSMDDQHSLAGIHSGPALLQLWKLGPIQQKTGSTTKPGLAYAIAMDHGCIWDMKFCPSGAWEGPATRCKSPQMSRLGLLAVAVSDGKVLLYSLPHAEDLYAYRRAQVTDGSSPRHAIYKVRSVASLQVGSIQAGSFSDCGQCFTVAWMPTKPHQHLAVGFYDGTVALWNLLSKSLLQRVRQPDGSLKLYPFHCFPAHDHAVRNIQWCKANSNFLVTAGNDRRIKFWDLRRLHEPVNSIKRFLSTEIAWLLPYCGITVAQDNCYASFGLCGIHYLDAGYLGFRAYFVAPRESTVWSISGSDWLNSVAAGDVTGELVTALMPDLTHNPNNVKRLSQRRFPIFTTNLLPYVPVGKEAKAGASKVESKTYKELVAQNYIIFQDSDLNFFKQKSKKKMPSKKAQEGKQGYTIGRLQLEAIHKVRFSPNLDCHSWLASGGQSGLVRVHCLQALASPTSQKLQSECQAQFSTMFNAEEQGNHPASDPSGLHEAGS